MQNRYSNDRRRFLIGAGSSVALGLTGLDALATIIHPGTVNKLLPSLADKLSGSLIAPDQSAYEFARRTASFNPRFDRYPLAIVACQSNDDVARSISFARKYSLPIAVRSGGHDVLAASTCNEGIVIDLSGFGTTAMSEDRKRMMVGAGARAGAVNYAAGAYGRAIPLGCNSQVGVSGLTLGGGMGWFVGNKGATVDHVLSATVVTVDGDVVTASATQNEDLFWAIRGGGGNFGVVTGWEFQSFDLDEVTCGAIVFPGEATRDFLAFYQEFLESGPEELTVEVIGNAYQRPVIAAAVCFSGNQRDADSVLGPLRRFATPIADGIAVRSFRDLESVPEDIAPFFRWQAPVIDDEEPAQGSYWQGTSIAGLSDDMIDLIADALSVAPDGWSFGVGHMMRGQFLRSPAGATPLVRQPGAVTVHFDGGWNHQSRADEMMNWIDASTASVVSQSRNTPSYVNYLSSNSTDRIEQAYGEHYRRLAKIKSRYDPDNVLRLNRNIAPA